MENVFMFIDIPIDSIDVQLSNHCLGVKSKQAENQYDKKHFDSNGFYHPIRSFGIGWNYKIKDDRILGAKRVVILQKRLEDDF